MGQIVGLKINDIDNTATVFYDNVNKGSIINIYDTKQYIIDVVANQSIDYGHKVALQDINKGDFIMKFGEKIGVAVKDIKQGDHVHIHNLVSLRARGDLISNIRGDF